MAIQNNLTSSSIRKYLPSKVITGYGQTIVGLESWLYDDGFGDQWWQGVIGAPVRWILTADVFSAAHSSHLTRVPNTYTGLDITPGMWVFSVTEPRAVRIVSIISLSDTSIQCIVEDVDRYNTFADASQTGTGAFASNNNLVFFELGDDGLPVLNPLPVGIDLTITSQIESRFRVFNPTVENRFFQLNHGFAEGQVVRIDNVTGKFVNATSDDIYIAGTVLAVGPGPHYFYLSPSTKIIDDLEPGLPGVAGDLLGIDPVTGDRAVITGGNNALYIKMTNAVKAFTVGSIDTPVTYPGNIIKLNNHVIPFVGDTTVDASSIISAINSTTANHGVTASMGSPSTIVSGTVAYPTSTPTTNMQFTINGVSTIVSLPSISFGTSGQVGWWDVIRSVNEQTAIHGVYASFDSNTGFVVFTQSEGLDINFVNVTPTTTSGEDKTVTDMLGVPENNPAAATTRLKLIRADGGAITVTDVSGQFTIDAGIQSAANGSLPLALVVDKTMTATSSGQIVANLTALNAIASPRSGDQVYVQNGNTTGEWELYVRTGATWTMIANYDSAKTDASTMTVDVTKDSAVVSLGNVSSGTRIVNVTVVVTTPFNSQATISVGTASTPDEVITSDNTDLSNIGSYEANTTYIYEGDEDGELFVHLDSAGSSTGAAKVIVSYL
jgi:hypothetical protein